MASSQQPLSIPFTTLDVFTSTPFTGNPLAIIHLPSSDTLRQTQKQAIAKEFNLSETVFLHPQTKSTLINQNDTEENSEEYQIDIFTTDQELPFAGHPTIGSASYVLHLSGKRVEKAVLRTKAGPIPISLTPSNQVLASVPFNTHLHNSTLSSHSPSHPHQGLSADAEIREAEMKAELFSIVKGMTFLLVQLPSIEVLGKVKITGLSPEWMGCLDEEWREGFVGRYYFVLSSTSEESITSSSEVKIRTRMVEAKMEDPATGSAASALGAYLAGKWGRSSRFEIVQGVEMGRRSVIGVEVDVGEGKVVGVRLSGEAVVVMEGRVTV